MVSSTVLTLLVIPAVYSLWKEREVRRAEQVVPTNAGDSTAAALARP